MKKTRSLSVDAKVFYSQQFVIFLLTGGLAALTNFLSRIFLNSFLSFSASVIIAYIIGMVMAFILFRTVVFDAREKSLKKSITLFCFVNVFGILQTYLISVGLYYWLLPYMSFDFYPDTVSHLVGIMVPAFTSFIGHKYWTFAS